MKQTKGFQIWQIIYPVGLYYVVSSLCYFALEILLGSADETYMLRQLVGDAVTIPVILKFYMADQNIRDTVYGKKKFRFSSEQAINIAVTVVSVAALGIAVNNIIAMTSLIQASEGFQTANQAFFAGAAVYEFLGSCFLIPIAEELLFRGVVYQRLKLMLGVAPAIICSALIFGLGACKSGAVSVCGQFWDVCLHFCMKKQNFSGAGTGTHRSKHCQSCVVRMAVLWLYDGCERNWIYGSDACGGWRCDMGVLEVEEECGI